MGTLNPDLLSKDLDAVMNDAVALKDEYRKPTLQPELILLALLRHPDQLRRLREDPALIGSAVEELLRYDGPVQRTARIPSEDITIGTQTIPKREMVMPFLGAANRDPAQFPDPDRLDITRADNRHIAFGMGIHFCLGAPLARMEGQIAINTLLRRMPKLALATQQPEHRKSLTLRGLVSLPVAF